MNTIIICSKYIIELENSLIGCMIANVSMTYASIAQLVERRFRKP